MKLPPREMRRSLSRRSNCHSNEALPTPSSAPTPGPMLRSLSRQFDCHPKESFPTPSSAPTPGPMRCSLSSLVDCEPRQAFWKTKHETLFSGYETLRPRHTRRRMGTACFGKMSFRNNTDDTSGKIVQTWYGAWNTKHWACPWTLRGSASR